MKRILPLILGLLLASIVSASELSLPPNLELVSQDSSYIVLLDKESGLQETLLVEGGKISPSWPITDELITDNCRTFLEVGHTRALVYDFLGDADHDGLPEIIGVYGGRSWICEYSGHDTTYTFQDTIYDALPLDYAKDSDGDGILEYLSTGLFHDGADLFEGPDSSSLPLDSVYSWPYGYIGGIYDIDGDGKIEVCLKPSGNRIYVHRYSPDSGYVHVYTIAMPDTIGARFTYYIYGDLDSDGINEVAASSDIGVICVFEYVAPDSFTEVWRGQVSHYNDRFIAGPTDMDNDGNKEFFVMSQSVSMGGFFWYHFEATGDNQFRQVEVDSLPGNVFELGGMGLWDFDHDGIDELAVGTANKIALFKSVGDDDNSLIYLDNRLSACIYIGDSNANGWGEIILDGGNRFGTVFLEYTPGLGVQGDVNLDCKVDLLDVGYLVNHFKGYGYPLPHDDPYQADVNGNCHINGMDVTYLVNYLKGGAVPIDGNCR